jgi:putative chitinase
MGIDLENNPTRASEPPIASKVALSYWFQRVKPRVKDFEDTKRVTKLINGGQNGLADRIKKLNKYKDAGFQPAEKLCAS